MLITVPSKSHHFFPSVLRRIPTHGIPCSKEQLINSLASAHSFVEMPLTKFSQMLLSPGRVSSLLGCCYALDCDSTG